MGKNKGERSRSKAVKVKIPRYMAAPFEKRGKISGLHLETPLHMAVLNNDVETVKDLINHGAEVDLEDSSFGTPLHFASTMGYPKVVRELLRLGANVNGSPNRRDTPLHCVIIGRRNIHKTHTLKGNYPSVFLNSELTADKIENRLEIIDTLSDEGAELNNFEGYQTPLHVSVKYNLFPLSERLIARRAKIDLFDERGKTVMYYASVNGSRRHVELLLKAGANVNAKTLKIRNAMKYTAFQNAVYHNNERVASVLINAGADLENITDAFSSQRMSSSLFHLLLDSGLQIMELNSSSFSFLLRFLLIYDNIDIYACLFDRCLDLNTSYSNEGITSLDLLNLTCSSAECSSRVQWIIALIVKLESENNFKICQTDSKLVNTIYLTYYNQCKEEFELLKKTNIVGNIKFYDLLVQPFRKLEQYSRNVELIKNLDSGACNKFPAYGKYIESRMRFAHKRKELLAKCFEKFTELISPVSLEPYVVLHILNYLNLSNLQSLSRI